MQGVWGAQPPGMQGGATGAAPRPGGKFKLLFACSSSPWKGQVYPGVLALFREIDRQQPRGPEGEDSRKDADLPRPFFLGQWLSRAETRPMTDPLWLRKSTTEWIKVSVPRTETVARLQSRLEEVRAESAGGSEALDGLDQSFADVSFSPPSGRTMSNLVFLSARPHAYKDYLASLVCAFSC